MDALKELFNKPFYEHLATEFRRADSNFDAKSFVKKVTENLDDLSLNQRMRNTSIVLPEFLPTKFEHSVELMKKVIPNTKRGYTNLLFPDFVSVHGMSNFDTSMKALHFFTQFGSSEFAVRVFLKADFDKALNYMNKWASDKNHHVRRLASEGSRPRLPWSFKLEKVIQEPEHTRSILEALKADKELYVRKSVANHLNDLSKENSDYMLNLIKTWDQQKPETAWIIKHASRTLIKKGHAGSMQIFGFENKPQIEIANFKLKSQKIKLGQNLEFEFDIVSKKSKPQKLVIDYIIHYVKKSGELSPKVFKLSETNLESKQIQHFKKKQILKDFTTRKHYAGRHELEIQVNGSVFAKTTFKLGI